MPSLNPKSYETTPSRKVAFLGLGVMGFPMAGHLAQAGHQVTVYNRTPAKAQAWVREFGGAAAATPREAAAGADIVYACVGNDADLRSVVLGPDGAYAGMKAAAVFTDHTTPRPRSRVSSMPWPASAACISSMPRSRAASRRAERHADRHVRRRCGGL